MHSYATFSFVILRTLSHGAMKSYVPNGEFGHKSGDFPFERYVLAGILDLNGDGVMEVIVESSYYEGGGDEVYEIKNGRPRRVLEVVDGA